MITTLLLVALASPPPPPPLPGQKWQWDGIHPSTLTLVGASPSAEAASAEAVEIVDCWALAWELPPQPRSAFGAARRW